MEAKKNENEYIPLREAIGYCHYSQEYLSLRARQGKLKALKFGKNWVTTKEWLQEYLGKTDENKNFLKSDSFKIQSKEPNRLKTKSIYYFGLGIILIFILIFANIFFSKIPSRDVLETVSLYISNYQFASLSIQDIFRSTWNVFKEYARWIMQLLEEII